MAVKNILFEIAPIKARAREEVPPSPALPQAAAVEVVRLKLLLMEYLARAVEVVRLKLPGKQLPASPSVATWMTRLPSPWT